MTWATCVADLESPCIGIQIEKNLCLQHLDIATRRQHLEQYPKFTSLDCRGTRFDSALLHDFHDIFNIDPAEDLRALTGGGASFERATFEAGSVLSGLRFGRADFENAVFEGDVTFRGAQFLQGATFKGAQFKGDANFNGALFDGKSTFARANFLGDARFLGAKFRSDASFNRASFDDASFENAQCDGDISFVSANFDGDASFAGAKFGRWFNIAGARVKGDIALNACRFDSAPHVGPIAAHSVIFTAAEFASSVSIEIEAEYVQLNRSRFLGGVGLSVAGATVDATYVHFGELSSISSARGKFDLLERNRRRDHSVYGGSKRDLEVSDSETSPSSMEIAGVRSLLGTDVANLVLTDIDLASCRFAGSHNLDKLKFEGECTFSYPSRGWKVKLGWPPVWRWSTRQIIAEEIEWRQALESRSVARSLARTAVDNGVSAKRLEGLYRTLRKALEDGKNEAGSGDFYYGEMEARRSSAKPIERAILSLYWLFSGYGQRAGRAVTALILLVLLSAVGLAGWGLPEVALPSQLSVTVDVSKPGPEVIAELRRVNERVLALPANPWTFERFEKGVRIALGSVVFRDAGQPLTKAGVWMLNLGRLLGPVLIALAALAIRARVKR